MTRRAVLAAAAAVAAAALLAGGASGFAPSPKKVSPPAAAAAKAAKAAARTRSASSTTLLRDALDAGTGWDSFQGMQQLKDVPPGEAQRKFRRTVYTHDDWKKHRSQDRFVYYLAAIFKSGVYKNLAGEVGITVFISVLVILWNAAAGGYTDLDGVNHAALVAGLPKLGLPLVAFTLTSPSLGLLLVFRTNSSYQRWDEARKNWGMNINHTRDLVRMANCYYDTRAASPEQRADDLNHVALCTWAFVRAMKRHLSPEEEDEQDFQNELREKLPPQQADMIVAAAHRPNRALQDLSYAIDDLPMHFIRKNEIQRAVTIFEDDLGSSERILTSPVPLFYSRHLARFLAIWLFLLPLGAYDSFASTWNHAGLIPTAAVIATMLFGIEEIGTQLEEPFTVLPMQAFCDKIYNWCMEISSWSPGDNGRPMKPIRPEHEYFADAGVAPAPLVAPPPPQQYAPPPVAAQSYAEPAPPAAPQGGGPSVADLNAQWAAQAMGRGQEG